MRLFWFTLFSQKCSICKDKKKKPKKLNGATSGCAYKRCSKTFHFYCAKCNDVAITKRMERKSESGKVMVLYRSVLFHS